MVLIPSGSVVIFYSNPDISLVWNDVFKGRGLITRIQEDLEYEDVDIQEGEYIVYIDSIEDLPELVVDTFSIYFLLKRGVIYISSWKRTEEWNQIEMRTLFIPTSIPFSGEDIPDRIRKRIQGYQVGSAILIPDGDTFSLVGIKLRPEIDAPDGLSPYPVKEKLWSLYLGTTGSHLLLHTVGIGILEFLEDILLLYDYGFSFSSNDIEVDKRAIYTLLQDDRFLIRFPTLISSIGSSLKRIKEIKEESDSIVSLDSRDEEVERINERMHLCDPRISWLLVPSSYYEFWKWSDSIEKNYQWYYKQDTFSIQIDHSITQLLLSLVNKVQMDIPIENQGRKHISFSLPSDIQKILQEINRNGIKILLAGDFSLIQDEYHFYILNEDVSVYKEFLSLLSNIIPPDDINVNHFHVRYKEYCITISPSMDSILDILYSFPMSHQMMGTDGYVYYLTPEFISFTSGSLSLIRYPSIRREEIVRCVRYGLQPVYLGVEPQIVDIPSIPDQKVEHINIYTYTGILPREQHKTYESGTVINGDTVSSLDISPDAFYLDALGINQGYYPIDKEKSYYIESVDGVVFLIREVSSL